MKIYSARGLVIVSILFWFVSVASVFSYFIASHKGYGTSLTDLYFVVIPLILGVITARISYRKFILEHSNKSFIKIWVIPTIVILVVSVIMVIILYTITGSIGDGTTFSL